MAVRCVAFPQPLVVFPSMEKPPLLRFFEKTKFCRKHRVLLEKVEDCWNATQRSTVIGFGGAH